jgi:tetratricopeptide (TPR) repeat protein
MNAPSVSYIAKTLLSLLFIACLVLTPSLVQAQEYTEEEYQAYEAIRAEKDANKKVDMIVAFVKQQPKSALKEHVVNEYQTIIVGLQNDKNWAQTISMGRRFLNVVPDDSFTFSALAAAYSATNDTKGFATFGEKAYASKPSAALALAVAKAYLSLGNDAKFLQWGQRTIAQDPDNVEILDEMTRKYLARQDMANAVKYSKMTLKALPNAKKPDNVKEQDWKNNLNMQYATAYYAIGTDAYQKQNYSGAISNLDKAVKYYKRNDYAYYFLGVSYWQMNKLQSAMLNFAKAYVLKGSVASEAKKHLEELWKNSHRGSLSGIERIIQQAQQDLK